MDKLLRKIINYLDHVIANDRLYVSVHFDETVYDLIDTKVIDALIPYIAHNNPYCRFVRSDPERHKLCMKNQKRILSELEGRECLIHTCYASAREIAYPVRLDGRTVGFATVSGYKSEGGEAYIDRILGNTALIGCEIPKNITDAIVPPLCFMLESLLSVTERTGSNEHNRILAYVSENFTTVTLDELASHFGRSRSYISHLFKRMTGRSIRAYCNELKLFTSERLLQTTEATVTDVALESGFEDTSYFVRLFKEKYGVTPYKYKKTYLTSKSQNSIIKTENN